MTDSQIDALFEELAALYHESKMEARALRQMLAARGVIDEQELDQRIESITREELLDLRTEMYRRAFAKALKDGPRQ